MSQIINKLPDQFMLFKVFSVREADDSAVEMISPLEHLSDYEPLLECPGGHVRPLSVSES